MEWQSSQPDVASPTHLHVNPRALSVGQSELAQEFEEEILSLSFEDQRYPPPPLARKQCSVYHESLAGAEYAGLIDAIGYGFTLGDVVKDDGEASPPFGERLLAILRDGAGQDTSYFGYGRYWVTDRLAELQVPWMGECDTAGGVRTYRKKDADKDSYYLVVRRSLEPEKAARYRVLALDDDGSAQEIYIAPGVVLMAMPLPADDNYWLLSTEGWKSADDEGPADPRWQTVYLVNLRDPEQYQKVQYPNPAVSRRAGGGPLRGFPQVERRRQVPLQYPVRLRGRGRGNLGVRPVRGGLLQPSRTVRPDCGLGPYPELDEAGARG